MSKHDATQRRKHCVEYIKVIELGVVLAWREWRHERRVSDVKAGRIMKIFTSSSTSTRAACHWRGRWWSARCAYQIFRQIDGINLLAALTLSLIDIVVNMTSHLCSPNCEMLQVSFGNTIEKRVSGCGSFSFVNSVTCSNCINYS